MTDERTEAYPNSPDSVLLQQYLHDLRTGTRSQKAQARDALAEMCLNEGSLDDAIELCEENIDDGQIGDRTRDVYRHALTSRAALSNKSTGNISRSYLKSTINETSHKYFGQTISITRAAHLVINSILDDVEETFNDFIGDDDDLSLYKFTSKLSPNAKTSCAMAVIALEMRSVDLSTNGVEEWRLRKTMINVTGKQIGLPSGACASMIDTFDKQYKDAMSAGSDPYRAVAEKVCYYWAIRDGSRNEERTLGSIYRYLVSKSGRLALLSKQSRIAKSDTRDKSQPMPARVHPPYHTMPKPIKTDYVKEIAQMIVSFIVLWGGIGFVASLFLGSYGWYVPVVIIAIMLPIVIFGQIRGKIW